MPKTQSAIHAQSRRRDNQGENDAGPSRPRPKPYEQRDASGLPGVSKLKASIRQTRRFLAKDNLEPGLRISTQRRLVSLEADLAKAQRRQVEQKNGERYHKVKFFERQKLVRLIKRFKRLLLDGSTAKSKKKRAKVEDDLQSARIMLNYILHFPNDHKYISLFPPVTDDEEAPHDPEAQLRLPDLLSQSQTNIDDLDKSDRTRLEILLRTKEMMQNGELSQKPEDELDRQHNGESGRKRQIDTMTGSTHAPSDDMSSKKRNQSRLTNGKVAGDEDDFFEAE